MPHIPSIINTKGYRTVEEVVKERNSTLIKLQNTTDKIDELYRKTQGYYKGVGSDKLELINLRNYKVALLDKLEMIKEIMEVLKVKELTWETERDAQEYMKEECVKEESVEKE